jgi:hypothetical protein
MAHVVRDKEMCLECAVQMHHICSCQYLAAGGDASAPFTRVHRGTCQAHGSLSDCVNVQISQIHCF